MSKGFMSQMTRPEEGERGLGASHRRGGMGVASYRRPPEGLVKALVRVESPTSKAPGAERKVESMRDKGAKRAANRKLHIDDGCMGGGGSLNKFDEKFTDSVKDALSSNKYGTGSNKGFDHTKDNFYYCVFTYKNEEGSSTAYGTAYSVPGYYFVVYDANTNNRNQKQETEFIHELGHHLHGYNNPKYSYAYNPAASHLTKANSDTNDHNAHCPNNCALKSSSDCGLFEIRPADYCDECWNSIRLDGRDGSYL